MKKGSKAPMILGVLLLLVVGAAAILYVGPNLAPGLFGWLPFTGSAHQAQQPVENVPADRPQTAQVPLTVADTAAQTPATQVQPLQTTAAPPLPLQAQPVQKPPESSAVQVSPPPVPIQAPIPSGPAGAAPPVSTAPPPAASATSAFPASSGSGADVPPAETGYAQPEPQQDSVLPAYDQVRMGMPSATVKTILGDPLEVKKVGRTIEWEYDTGTGFFEVRFQRDKVVYTGVSSYHTPKPAPVSRAATVPPASGQGAAGLPPGTAPSPSDYDRITVGMTSDAVMQILGNPSQVKRLRTSVEWEYETPRGTFEVRFRNNRVNFKGMVPGPPKAGTPAPGAAGTGAAAPQ